MTALYAAHAAPVLADGLVEGVGTWPLGMLLALAGGLAGWLALRPGRARRPARDWEAMYRGVTASLRDAVLVMDSRGRIVDWNEAATRMFGHTREAALGRDLHELIVPERYHPAFHDGLQGFRRHGEGPFLGRTQELRAQHLDGRELPVEVTLSACRLEGTWHAIGTLRDISERELARHRLQEQREHIERSQHDWLEAFDAVRDPIFLHDWRGRILQANHAYLEEVGLPQEAIIGRPYWEVFPRLEGPLPGCIDAQSVRDGERNDEVALDNGRVFNSRAYALWDEAGRYRHSLHIMEDITEQRHARRVLEARAERFRGLFENAPLGYQSLDPEGRIVAVNRAWLDTLGYRREEVEGRPFEDLLLPGARAEFEYRFSELQASGEIHEVEFPARRGDGREILLAFEGRIAREEDGAPRESHCIVVDITERRRAEEGLRLAASVFGSSAEGIIITDAEGRIVAINPAFTHITGYTEADVLGRNPRLLRSGRHDRDFYQGLWSAVEHTGHWSGEIWNRNKDGEVYPEWLTMSVVRDAQGTITHYVGIFSDISALKRSEQQLEHLAHHDALTGLPNRLLFNARLDHSLEQARRSGHQVAVLFLDLDGFKNINDSMGHPTGDEVLRQVAVRLSARMRKDDTVARLGGDEFIIVMDRVRSPQDAARLARELIEDLRPTFAVDGNELFVTTSIGIALYPRDGEDVATLVQNADAAMFRAKEEGRGNYQFYTRDLTASATQRVRLETELRRALDGDQIQVYYQSQVDLRDGKVVGAEALVRWRHPQRGLLLPADFLGLAEETGLIVPLGQQVLRSACRQLVSWRAAGLDPGLISVNLGARQIYQSDLAQRIATILRETGCGGELLELEVTEDFMMRRSEASIAALRALRDQGLRLAIDDFGTGYSSLSYLRRLPVSKLKIDRSFIHDIGQDAGDEAIIRAIVALGDSLGLEVVAEGVETEAQAEFLRAQGCGYAQGYLYAHPTPAAEYARSLAFAR